MRDGFWFLSFQRFALATRDLESVDWTANGRAIVVADTSLTARILIDGECLTFS